MAELTHNVLKQIFKDLVLFAPSVRPGVRLNCYAYLDSRAQYNAPDLGMTYEDYTNGYFWNRDWINQGALSDAIRKDYAMLLIEHKYVSLEDMDGTGEQARFILSVVDTPSCGKRVNLDRPREVVYEDCKTMLKAAVYEMGRYKPIDITPTVGDPYTAWMTEDRAQAMQDAGVISSFVPVGGDVWSSIWTEMFEIYKNPVLNVDGAYGVTCELVISVCSDDPLSYTYSETVPGEKGRVIYADRQ
jgi:hypothetical protein